MLLDPRSVIFFAGFMGVLVANLLLFWGCLLYYIGSQRFFGEQPVLRNWLSLTMALGAVLAWFTLVQPSYAVRLACFTLCASAVFMSHAAL